MFVSKEIYDKERMEYRYRRLQILFFFRAIIKYTKSREQLTSCKNCKLGSSPWSVYLISRNLTCNKVAINRFLWIVVLLFLRTLEIEKIKKITRKIIKTYLYEKNITSDMTNDTNEKDRPIISIFLVIRAICNKIRKKITNINIYKGKI